MTKKDKDVNMLFGYHINTGDPQKDQAELQKMLQTMKACGMFDQSSGGCLPEYRYDLKILLAILTIALLVPIYLAVIGVFYFDACPGAPNLPLYLAMTGAAASIYIFVEGFLPFVSVEENSEWTVCSCVTFLGMFLWLLRGGWFLWSSDFNHVCSFNPQFCDIDVVRHAQGATIFAMALLVLKLVRATWFPITEIESEIDAEQKPIIRIHTRRFE